MNIDVYKCGGPTITKCSPLWMFYSTEHPNFLLQMIDKYPPGNLDILFSGSYHDSPVIFGQDELPSSFLELLILTGITQECVLQEYARHLP